MLLAILVNIKDMLSDFVIAYCLLYMTAVSVILGKMIELCIEAFALLTCTSL